MVFPEDADLAVRVAERKAVQEEAEFGGEGDGDDDGRCKLNLLSARYLTFPAYINRNSYMELGRR